MAIISVSAEDVQKLPEFRHLSLQQLLHPKYDKRIKELMSVVGGNASARICVQACQHRTSSNKVVVSWRYVLPERTDKEWLDSGKASIEARIAGGNRSMFDAEVMALSGVGSRVSNDGMSNQVLQGIRKHGYKTSEKEREECLLITNQIIALQMVQKSVRGALLADEDVLFEHKTEEENLQSDTLQMLANEGKVVEGEVVLNAHAIINNMKKEKK